MSIHARELSQPERMAPLLNIDEAAAFLGVSRRQVYVLLDRDELPYVRVGHRTRFLPGDLLAWVKRHNGPRKNNSKGGDLPKREA